MKNKNHLKVSYDKTFFMTLWIIRTLMVGIPTFTIGTATWILLSPRSATSTDVFPFWGLSMLVFGAGYGLLLHFKNKAIERLELNLIGSLESSSQYNPGRFQKIERFLTLLVQSTMAPIIVPLLALFYYKRLQWWSLAAFTNFTFPFAWFGALLLEAKIIFVAVLVAMAVSFCIFHRNREWSE